MSRRKPELQTIDVAAWPTVAHTELDEPVRPKFEARRQTILRYIAGEPIRIIEETTRFNRRQLYRWLERAQTTHADGRPFGSGHLSPTCASRNMRECMMCRCAASAAAAVPPVRSRICLNATRR
ncbi:hypothetical protein OKW46_001146 [Paraburkholderia sp. WSM4179]|nr:hypothetical protein [Paraburkholderia sp. WSM4179]